MNGGRAKITRVVRRRGSNQAPQSYQPGSQLSASPSPMQKARHLVGALKRWQASGRKKADRATRKTRGAICAACPHWSRWGNLGLGECKHPQCGCTRAKLWLATERCPMGKWEALV